MIHVYHNVSKSTSAYDCLRTESKCGLKSDHCGLGLVGLYPTQDDEHNSINIGNVAVRLCIYALVVFRDILVQPIGL
jgi:hypothetical protein